LLFTRYLAGPADFTPVALLASGRGETTPAFQLAAGVLMTSPLLVLAELPETYLASPARPLLERLPAAWDDTRVLPGSEIGGLAGLIRRSGEEWWIAAITPGPETILPVTLRFLPPGEFRAEIWRDGEGGEPEASHRPVKRRDSLELPLAAGAGAVVRLVPDQE
jgi:alpha-glucosidase